MAHRRPLKQKLFAYLASAPAPKLRWLCIPLVVWLFVGIIFAISESSLRYARPFEGILYNAPKRMNVTVPDSLPSRVSCLGPRGKLLDTSRRDNLKYGRLDTSYPIPFIGSNRELGLGRTWMTADGRYGPYGFGENDNLDKRLKMAWDTVDWGQLQSDCLHTNEHRFTAQANVDRPINHTRLSLVNEFTGDRMPSWEAYSSTRRTAIVIRAWEGFQYEGESLWTIRSLVAEAALRSGGEYTIILLVNVLDEAWKIHESPENYDKAFRAMNIPPELQSIAVLWDNDLLESWYPKVEEHRPMWQINQPLQVLALHYPEFDHFWQVELDQRYMGSTLEYFDAMTKFARLEPRKQSLERATYPYSEQLYSSYDALLNDVDAANDGQSRAWPAVEIPKVRPIGPMPPRDDPSSDRFDWGVGEEAAFISSSFCADVRTTPWIFAEWFQGINMDTPRWFCPPAIFRASRDVILYAHKGNYKLGISLPSEATMPTWALWLGLKISYPPQPVYMHAHDEERQRSRPEGENDETSRLENEWRNPGERPFFGDLPHRSKDGLSMANPQSYADLGLTFWWKSKYPRRIMDVWLNNEVDAEDMPSMLRVHKGKVYAPNFVMHPVKTS